jgi:hypothetical protein
VKLKRALAVVGALCLSLSSQISVSAEAQSLPNNDNFNVFKASDIRFLKTLPGDPEVEKKKALKEHSVAIDIINKHIKDNGIQIETDLDNPEYQQFVKSLGVAYGLFSEADMEKVVSFVKFIDLYENYAINDKIKAYKDKLEKNMTLSEDEIDELIILMPITPNAPSTADNKASDSASVSTTDISVAASNGYDNIAARDYAYEWWNGRNPVYSSYYADKYGCKIDEKCWNDCANFVSQALHEAGMKYKYGSNYQDPKSWSFGVVPSYTWGGAHNFYLHWRDRAGVAAYVSDLQTGDAVNADFAGDGHIDHTALITRNTGSSSSNKYLTQHTYDAKEVIPGTNTAYTLAKWYNDGYTVFGYEMDKATN